mmetsp:Transcript_997/g.2397  ORF Transcript_997/g.2397 Transcript_997/m.2397 type:complete len:504 (-) Transcript_997:961-2472(-)
MKVSKGTPPLHPKGPSRRKLDQGEVKAEREGATRTHKNASRTSFSEDLWDSKESRSKRAGSQPDMRSKSRKQRRDSVGSTVSTWSLVSTDELSAMTRRALANWLSRLSGLRVRGFSHDVFLSDLRDGSAVCAIVDKLGWLDDVEVAARTDEIIHNAYMGFDQRHDLPKSAKRANLAAFNQAIEAFADMDHLYVQSLREFKLEYLDTVIIPFLLEFKDISDSMNIEPKHPAGNKPKIKRIYHKHDQTQAPVRGVVRRVDVAVAEEYEASDSDFSPALAQEVTDSEIGLLDQVDADEVNDEEDYLMYGEQYSDEEDLGLEEEALDEDIASEGDEEGSEFAPGDEELDDTWDPARGEECPFYNGESEDSLNVEDSQAELGEEVEEDNETHDEVQGDQSDPSNEPQPTTVTSDGHDSVEGLAHPRKRRGSRSKAVAASLSGHVDEVDEALSSVFGLVIFLSVMFFIITFITDMLGITDIGFTYVLGMRRSSAIHNDIAWYTDMKSSW